MAHLVITNIMDALYKKYLIPMTLFNEKDEPLYPAITWDTSSIVKKFLRPAKEQAFFSLMILLLCTAPSLFNGKVTIMQC